MATCAEATTSTTAVRYAPFAIRADLRYIQIEPDVTLNGVAMGSAKINPLVAGIAYVMKF